MVLRKCMKGLPQKVNPFMHFNPQSLRDSP